MIANPGAVLQSAIRRVNYNAGRVLKEAGLSKLPKYFVNFFDNSC